jgi:hypothetical protein
MRKALLVLVFMLSSFHVRAEDQPKCVSVTSGNIVSTDNPGSSIPVDKGTWCPDPVDKEVAKTLVRLDSEVKEWKVRYGASEEKRTRQEKYTAEIDLIWENKVKEQDEKIAYLSGFWNKTGRILLWCGLTAVATTITIYGAEKAGVIKW